MSCVVELGVASAEDIVGDGATRAVARPTRLRVAAVGRLQNGERQRVVVNASLTAGATEADDGLGAVSVLEVTNLLADGVESLVPSGALPLILTTILERALHRVDDAVVRIRVLAQGEVHGVNTTSGDGVVVVALDANELAILGDDLNAVSNRMRSRRGPGVGAGDDGAVLHYGLPLFTVCHTFLLSPRFLRSVKLFARPVKDALSTS